MLTGLDTINWSALQDAYGSAAEVPNRLRALLSDDDAVRSEALNELFGSVWHQGTIYSVSAHVVPFLVELIEEPQVRDKPSIIALLASIASGRGYYEVHEEIVQKLAKRPVDLTVLRREETAAVEAVRQIVSPYIPSLLLHLMHSESEVRCAIAQALPFYPEHRVLSHGALDQARRRESDPEVLAVFDEALAAISQTA